MNKQIGEMLCAAEGRYLTRAEHASLRELAAQLEKRLLAMEEIQTKEDVIVERALKDVTTAYPDYLNRHKDARAKGLRDLAFVLRYATQAMLRSDAEFLEDALLSWMRTILKGVGFTPQFIEDTYKTLERAATRELSPAVAELIRPYLMQCASSLSKRKPTA
jgi:hypothetical protein